MLIARKKEGGLNGQRTFDEARKPENIKENSYWTDEEIEIISDEEDNERIRRGKSYPITHKMCDSSKY